MTDDDELAMIRRKKMAQMMAREKNQQATRDKEQKVAAEREKLLQRFLKQDAYKYLTELRNKEPGIGQQMTEILLYLIVYRNIRHGINLLDVRYIERQVKGEEPKIRVQRDGETSDFGSYVREAMKKNSG